MKLALIGGLSALAMIVGVTAANSQAPQTRPTAGSGAPNAPFEWYAGPGPQKRGNMCLTHVDINRGYGYQAPCPAPKGAAAPAKAKKKKVATKPSKKKKVASR